MLARKEKQVNWENNYVEKVAFLSELAKERIAFLATFRLPGYEDKVDGSSAASGSAAGTVPGNGNEEKAWNFFAQNGFSPAAIAGIMGNLKQESGVDPKKLQNGGKGPGTGVAQWEKKHSKGGGRWEGLVSWAQSQGKDEWAIETQLGYLLIDLQQGTTKSILDKKFGGMEGLKKATDYKWAVEAFEQSFERAGKPNYENRYKYAKDYYDKWGKSGPSNATGGAKKVIEVAESWLNKPNTYSMGAGRTEADIKAGRFDCSSFCRYCFSEAGYDIMGNGALWGNTDTVIQNKALKVVKTADLQPGDLVFFDTYKQYGHITIYLGNNRCIGSQSSGVGIFDMNGAYWKPRISDTHRRVL